jgi:hypothetical protein
VALVRVDAFCWLGTSSVVQGKLSMHMAAICNDRKSRPLPSEPGEDDRTTQLAAVEPQTARLTVVGRQDSLAKSRKLTLADT